MNLLFVCETMAKCEHLEVSCVLHRGIEELRVGVIRYLIMVLC